MTGDDAVSVENPADESHVADVTVTPSDEIERAIAEARRSFDPGTWADLSAADRARLLHEFVDFIEGSAETLVPTLVAEAGQSTQFAEMTQLRAGGGLARQTIDLYLAMKHEEASPVPVDDLVRGRVALSIRRHEPVGVVTAITPYNAALIMGFQKLIPALMAGNSVILRPSPLTPISSLIFGMAAEAAGLPPGVLSVIVESGTAGAELLTSHPAVDMVSLTGSTQAGRKPCPGGTHGQAGFPGARRKVRADLPARHRAPRSDGRRHGRHEHLGPGLRAATRILVPEEQREQVLEAVGGVYRSIKVGPPTQADATMGPVISAAQRRSVSTSSGRPRNTAARSSAVAADRPGWIAATFEPTVLEIPDNANPAAQEEIFGPVLAVIGYRDLDHAVEIANDSIYGLSGQVYGADVATAVGVARRLRTGAVNVNTTVFSAYAPSGGYKQSGLGRERGPDGIRQTQEVKHMSMGELPQ